MSEVPTVHIDGDTGAAPQPGIAEKLGLGGIAGSLVNLATKKSPPGSVKFNKNKETGDLDATIGFTQGNGPNAPHSAAHISVGANGGAVTITTDINNDQKPEIVVATATGVTVTNGDRAAKNLPTVPRVPGQITTAPDRSDIFNFAHGALDRDKTGTPAEMAPLIGLAMQAIHDAEPPLTTPPQAKPPAKRHR